MTIDFNEGVAAAGASVFDAHLAPASIRAVTDTRSLRPGDTFVALRGDRFDGHAFVREARDKGALAVFVDNAGARVEGCTTCVVGDTLAAYMALAGVARAQFHGRVVAITGSAGKTTTKVFAAQLLATRYGDRVAASPANENNEIGVSKLLLSCSDELHDVVVVEMGARHFGDIAVLTAVAKPDVAVLTNVGEAHLEIMGSRERLEATKWSIFASGAQPVTNASDAVTRARAGALAREPHWFYAGDALPARLGDARASAVIGSERFVDVTGGARNEYATSVRVPGAHNRENLAAAAAAALECGADAAAIARAMPGVELPSGRYHVMNIAGMRVVYDAYNANASGTVAALDAFAGEPARRRVVLLSSMAELGDEARELHRRVGAHVAEIGADFALFGGDFADDLIAGALRAGLSSERIARFATNGEAAAWLRAHGREGDAVLLKGSRKYRLEEIVGELRA